MRRSFFLAAFASCFASACLLSAQAIELTVSAGDLDRVNVPVRTAVKLSKTAAAAKSVIITDSSGARFPG
ncbi:MAG: hypothetical protein N2C14_27035, partial [Planctomycetales bacterium]